MDQTKFDLTPEEITGIASFLGYGKPDAKVWFIGLEEGLGKSTDDEARENLKPRSRFQTVMDLREAHLNLKEHQKTIDIETKKSFTQVWLFMAKIMLARNGRKDWSDSKSNRQSILNEAKDYVRFSLGRRSINGDTFLTELSPIPTRRTNDMNWINRLKEQDHNLDQKIEQRSKQLKDLLRANNEARVICYGKRPDDFGELVGVKWIPVTRAISKSDNGKCLLLPFFGVGQMSNSVVGTLLKLGLL